MRTILRNPSPVRVLLTTVALSGVLSDHSRCHADRNPDGIPDPESEIRRLRRARQPDAPMDTCSESGQS